jgi:beta-N-acetylhexosaminidase
MPASWSPPETLEARIAQLMMVRIGSNLPPAITADSDAERIARLLDECPVGGLILFNGVWPSTRDALAKLQSRSAIPLLIGSDIERGCGQQMRGLGVLPHAMAFGEAITRGEVVDDDLAHEFGRLTALGARHAGIHIAFAPVSDTNTNPKNPIIATRAFANTPERVAELVAAFIKGCESHGVASTAKHFPGHGDTMQDSHDSLPEVPRDRASIAATELPPFVAAIQAGCSVIMTAHVAYPVLDPSGVPATLSHAILTRLLRDELGFEGVVCSDSLLMSGVRGRFDSEGELCAAALSAGIDLLLDVEDPISATKYLAKAVRDGSLDEQVIDRALARILALKDRVIQADPATPSIEQVEAEVAALGRRTALGAIESRGDASEPGLDTTQPLCVVLAKPFRTPLDPPEQPIAARLREHFASIDYIELDPHSTEQQYEQAQQSAQGAKQVLAVMIVKPAAWHHFGLLERQQRLFEQLATHPRVVLASLGVPTTLDAFPAARCRLCTYSDVAVSQQALADFVAGATG